MNASAEMPKYRSHKTVWALKIAMVQRDDPPAGHETDGHAMLHFHDERYAPRRVESAYVRKHNPQPGGYFVVYEDGYESWSPAEAFEAGYTLITR